MIKRESDVWHCCRTLGETFQHLTYSNKLSALHLWADWWVGASSEYCTLKSANHQTLFTCLTSGDDIIVAVVAGGLRSWGWCIRQTRLYHYVRRGRARLMDHHPVLDTGHRPPAQQSRLCQYEVSEVIFILYKILSMQTNTQQFIIKMLENVINWKGNKI